MTIKPEDELLPSSKSTQCDENTLNWQSFSASAIGNESHCEAPCLGELSLPEYSGDFHHPAACTLEGTAGLLGEYDLNLTSNNLEQCGEYQPMNALPLRESESESSYSDGEVTSWFEPTLCETPPVRVRFRAPATFQAEDESASFEGEVLNLSVSGLACSAQQSVPCGTRLWLTFRLELDASPVLFLCETIWQKTLDDGGYSYGLRFVCISREEAERIDIAVNQRSEGMSGEWPVPQMPSSLSLSRVNPWWTAAAGVIAGVSLAVLLSLAPERQVVSAAMKNPHQQIPHDSANDSTYNIENNGFRKGSQVGSAMVIKTPVILMVPEEKSDNKKNKTGVADSDKLSQKSAAIANVAGNMAGNVAKNVIKNTTKKRIKDITKRTDKTGTAKVNPIAEQGLPIVSGGSEKLQLTLKVDGLVKTYKAFWMSSPKRLVIDVFGRQHRLSKQRYELNHPMATLLRVGNHADKVRFVVETNQNLASKIEVDYSGNTLHVTVAAK